jgi:hypothetical protein
MCVKVSSKFNILDHKVDTYIIDSDKLLNDITFACTVIRVSISWTLKPRLIIHCPKWSYWWYICLSCRWVSQKVPTFTNHFKINFKTYCWMLFWMPNYSLSSNHFPLFLKFLKLTTEQQESRDEKNSTILCALHQTHVTFFSDPPPSFHYS